MLDYVSLHRCSLHRTDTRHMFSHMHTHSPEPLYGNKQSCKADTDGRLLATSGEHGSGAAARTCGRGPTKRDALLRMLPHIIRGGFWHRTRRVAPLYYIWADLSLETCAGTRWGMSAWRDVLCLCVRIRACMCVCIRVCLSKVSF